jgi:catechol 2,3-dioxygenase-like lactoylglutathione lyase family enzyme
MSAAHANGWPPELRELSAIRFSRYYFNFEEAVNFYRDLVGLPLYERFSGSYGSNGAIFALPTPSLTLEIVEATEPVSADPREQLCLYFPDERGQRAAVARLAAAGLEPVASHPYWEATGAVTYHDPDGREVVLAPFVYGSNEPSSSSSDGRHEFPGATGAA